MNITLLMGTIGFVCYYIYDVFSILKPESIARYLFRIGTILVVISFILEVYFNIELIQTGTVFFYLYLGLLFLCLLFLIYTLFFCFDLNETYFAISQMRMAYTKGMYALCRHPGVLWFAGMFLSLYGLIGTRETLQYTCCMILYNVIYIILQDIFIFPNTFSNYASYKRETPFLIPNRKSIKRCMMTICEKRKK